MKQFLQKVLVQKVGPLTLFTAALLTGCSGGSRTAGIEGTGDIMAAKGTVTAFGSVWVNGVRFDTTDAVIIVDSEASSEEAIMPGMVVEIEATVDEAGVAHAQTVVADALLQGPITHLNTMTLPYSEMQVLGQTVIIPEEVVWAGVERGGLTVGLNVRVSGLVRNDGSILATRIDSSSAARQLETEGVISAVDEQQYRLTLGSLEVDYSVAEFINGTIDDLALGQRVSVQGQQPADTAAAFAAAQIRFENPGPEKSTGSAVAWEGLIEAYNPAGLFELNDLVVDASAARVERGSANQLGNGVRVTVYGEMNTQGVLVAETVKLLLPNETRFATVVEKVDAGAQKVTLLSTTFSSDALTAFEDLSPGQNRKLGLSDIASGDAVEVFGRYINNEWVATRIRKLNNNQSASSFRGPVGEIVSESEFYVMGVLVDASEAVGADLVAELAPGDQVSVEGLQTGRQAVMATHIERVERSDCPAPVANACGAKADPGSNGNAGSNAADKARN